MKNFKAKKFLAALALGGVIVFACTAPAAEATIEISAVMKMEAKVVNWNKGADSDIIAVGVSRPDPRGLALSREAAIMTGAKKFSRHNQRTANRLGNDYGRFFDWA